MSAPVDPTEVERWVKFAEGLTPFQQINLIGLLDLHPELTPATIDVPRIVGEKRAFATGNWLSRNFHRVLSKYCAFCRTSGGEFATQGVGRVAPALMALDGMSYGAAVGCACWLVTFPLDKLCARYKPREYGGAGTYTVTPAEGPNEYVSAGQFALTYFPGYTQTIPGVTAQNEPRDVNIVVQAQAVGQFRTADGSAASRVTKGVLTGDEGHRFQFKDAKTGLDVSAVVDAVTDVEGAVVKFRAATYNLQRLFEGA